MRALAALLALASCASAPPAAPPPTADPLALVDQRLAGAFDNAVQFAAAPEALKRPPAAGRPYDWLDLQHATFRRVSAPALGAQVYYLEWRRGAADGPISRQRLWAFRTDDAGRPVMDFFVLADPERFAGKAAAPDLFKTLTAADVTGYPPGCTLDMTREGGVLVFHLRPQTCRVANARTGRMLRLAATIRLAADGVGYDEAGVFDDGSYAFKVPGGPAYAFVRTR